MYQAVWNNEIVAQSNECVIIEGNYYFPLDSIQKDYFCDSTTSTHCPWKGNASYFHLEVNGEMNYDCAWHYKNPSEKASHIKDYVAFWNGVDIQKVEEQNSSEPAETIKQKNDRICLYDSDTEEKLDCWTVE